MLLSFPLLSVLAAIGCEDSPVCDGCCSGDPCPPWTAYSQPTAPESLITNLQVAYRNREIEHYAALLAPEFIFKFQPIDANDIGTPFWTRDQDSSGTRALLTTTEVSDIRINLIYGDRDSIFDLSPPVDTLRVRIITTDLQVDQTDGTTWVVTDQQDFFFRKGKLTKGENPLYWWIYEWDDLPTLGSPALAGIPPTWGQLKTLFEAK